MEVTPSTRVLVTGASRGIGAAVADAFAARGCTVGRASRSGEPACDVADPDSIGRAVAAFGDVDVLVANAGIAHYVPFADMPTDQIVELTRVNWLGTVYTVKAALPGLLERRRGHIVIVSSGAGIRSFPGAAVYGATKAAQRGFAEALRHELSGSGVSVTTVFPGEIATALHAHEKESLPDWYHGGASAAGADRLAAAVLRAVERDRRAVYFPPFVRLLGLNGLAPRATDAILRRLRGGTVAPRRD